MAAVKLKKRAIIAVIVLVALSFAVKYFVFPKRFFYAGTLEGTKVDVSSQLSSTIDKVAAREGDHVKKGQTLVELSCPDFVVAYDIADINYNRNLKLLKAGTVTQEVLDQLKAKRDQAKIKVDWCVIGSPIDGTVLSRYHEPGERVDPGVRLMTLTDVKDIWAYIYVPQPEVASLKPGQQLTALLPEQHKNFVGKIEKINDEAEFTPKNVQTRAERTRLVYGVKVSFLGSNDEEILKPGMTVEIELPR
jgi:HlyD family secretion protein